jgi:DNA polymerase/3'-5' exonuclease PolX
MKPLSNEVIGERLNEYAEVLNQQNANRFRVLAYQRAASTVSGLQEPITRIYEG